jgi:glycosyltransferase involved in cell wall biosynthesis
MTISLYNPLVSAIITTKDRPHFIDRSAASVLAQTHRPLQVIIVDDGSEVPIERASFVVPEDVQLTILRNERSAGVSAARNRGVNSSEGEFVAFLDDDDRWLPQKLERQVQRLRACSPQVKACGCQLTVVDDDGALVAKPDRPNSREDIIVSLVLADENITPSTLMFERRSFIDLGGYREDMPAAEDREFLLRFLLKYDIVILSERLVDFTEHRGTRLTRNTAAMLAGELAFLDFVSCNLAALGIDRGRTLGYRNAKVGHQAMLARRWKVGLKHFLIGLYHYPFDKRVSGGSLLSLLGPRLYWKLTALRSARLR